MSSSAQGGAGGRGDKPQGLVKYIRKAGKVFKRTGSSKASPSVAPAEPGQLVPAVTSSSEPPSTSIAATTVPQQAVPQSPPDVVSTAPPIAVPAGLVAEPTVQAALQQAIKDIKPSTKIIANHRSATTAAVSCALMEEKARSLFAKYGLNMLPDDWSPYVREDAQRVEKKIRLRVRRTCHICSTIFGSDKLCKKCEHGRCKKCPRYPPKTYRDTQMGLPKDKGKGKSIAGPIDLTMPSRFAGKALPTELDLPADAEKAPPSARRELRAIRTHVRWECHQCSVPFKDTEKICRKCRHEQCENCSREPPLEKDEQLDPDAVQSVERKMKELTVSLQTSAPAA